jgi:hypothetical protein
MISSQEKSSKNYPGKALELSHRYIMRFSDLNTSPAIGSGQIMIAKPGKNPTEITSHRPISLLPLLSKILEKIILKRLTPILAVNNVIPSHQFRFRPKHGTIQQVHRINNDLENKQYCTAAFIDISQAFDKVWHMSLLFKLKQALPHPEYTLLGSYLTHRIL